MDSKTSNAYKRRSSKKRMIATISIVAFIVVAIGVAVALYFVNRIKIEKQNKEKEQQEQLQTPAEVKITYIELTKNPITKYFTSDTGFNATGGQITVHYNNDTTEVVNLTNDMITTTWDGLEGTDRKGTISYKGHTCSFYYDVDAREVEEIRLISNVRDVYLDFETGFDLDGAEIKLTYNDGDEQTIPVAAGYVDNGQFNAGVVGNYAATIAGTLQGQQFEFTFMYSVVNSLNYVKDITNITLLNSYYSADPGFESSTGHAPTMEVVYEFRYADAEKTKELSRQVLLIMEGSNKMISDFDRTITEGENKNVAQITYGNKTVDFEYTVAPEAIVEFNILGTQSSATDTVKVVNATTGELEDKSIAALQPEDQIALPTPAATYTEDATARKYFIGWAEDEAATVPDYYVGEDYITLSEVKTVLHAVYAEADETKWTFTPDDETTATYYTAAYNGETLGEDGILIVPNIYNGLPVTSITQRVDAEGNVTDAANTSVKRIIIANGVETVAEKAFVNCTAVTNVVFTPSDSKIFTQPEAVANIEVLSGITTISAVVPLEEREDEPTITAIGASAFSGCTSLESIKIPETVTEIGTNAFRDCSSLELIVIPKSVTTIGSEAFYACTGLESATFEEGINIDKIPAAMFRACSALKELNIPTGVTKIEALAFDACTALAEINIPSSVTEIGSYVFRNAGCERIDLSNLSQLTTLSQGAFQQCLAKIIILPETETLTTFEKEMFYNSPNLERITTDESDPNNYALPSVIKGTINAWFRNCPSLQRIHLPKGIDEVYVWAFQGCSSLTEIKFHEETNLTKLSVDGIELAAYNTEYRYNNIFTGCTSLEEITMPLGWQIYDVHTFSGCTSLKKIKFLDPTIKFRACLSGTKSQIFYDCTSLETIEFVEGASVDCFNWYIHWGQLSLKYDDAGIAGLFASCSNLKYIGIPNAEGKIEVNALPGYNKVHTSMFQGTAIESYQLPESLTEIPSFAFAGCRNLRSITIPNTVTRIKNQAFSEAGLLSLTLPESVQNIEYRAFWCMETLASIEIKCKNLISGGEIFQAEYKSGETYLGLPTNLSVITFADTCESVQFTRGDFTRCSNNLIVVFERTVDGEGNIDPTVLNTDSISLLRLSGQIRFYMASAAADEYYAMFDSVVDASGRTAWVEEQKTAWLEEQKATWLEEQKAEWLEANTDKTEDDWAEVEATYVTQYENSVLATHTTQYETTVKAEHIEQYNDANGIDYVLRPLGVPTP